MQGRDDESGSPPPSVPPWGSVRARSHSGPNLRAVSAILLSGVHLSLVSGVSHVSCAAWVIQGQLRQTGSRLVRRAVEHCELSRPGTDTSGAAEANATATHRDGKALEVVVESSEVEKLCKISHFDFRFCFCGFIAGRIPSHTYGLLLCIFYMGHFTSIIYIHQGNYRRYPKSGSKLNSSGSGGSR